MRWIATERSIWSLPGTYERKVAGVPGPRRTHCQRKGSGFSRSFAKKGAFIHRRAEPFRAERLRVKAAVFLFALHGEGPPKANTPRNKSRTLSLGQTSGFVVYT